MKLNGKKIKDMTKEEIKEYLKDIESNPLESIIVSALYGSVDNLRNIIDKELKQIDKANDKEKDSDLNMEQKIMRDTIERIKKGSGLADIKNSNKIKEEKIENNINKKCIIVNHPYLKDNTQGVIKDKVDLTQQYVVVINDKDIVYIDKENVEIIENEWKDIKFQGYNKELDANYSILIKEDLSVIVNIWSDDMFTEYTKEYYFSLPELKPLVQNYKENKNSIIEYVLGKIKIQQYKKQSEDIDTQLNNLQKQQNQIQDKINKEEIKMQDIIGKKVKNLEQ